MVYQVAGLSVIVTVLRNIEVTILFDPVTGLRLRCKWNKKTESGEVSVLIFVDIGLCLMTLQPSERIDLQRCR